MSVLNQMLRDLESRGAEADTAANAVLEPSVPATPIVRPLAPSLQEAGASRMLRVAAWGGVALIVAATGAAHVWYARHLDEFARAPQPLGMRQFAGLALPAATLAATAPRADAPLAAPPSGNDDQASHSKVTAPTDLQPDPTAARPDNLPAVAVTTQPPSLTTSAALPPSATPATTRSSNKAGQPAIARARPEKLPKTASADETTVRPAPQVVASTPATTTDPPAATDSAAIISRPANPAAALEARAAELLGRGRSVEAMALLVQVLQQAPDNGKARATLAALQAESGRRDHALQTLLAGAEIEPARFASSAARLQADFGDAAGALATLERVPEAARNATLDALAGGIAQRAGEHKRAVDAYRRALRAPNAPAIWWAGLAISFDALEQSAPALEAFRRAAADPSLPAAARSFALDRISALSAAVRTGEARAGDGALVSARQ